MRRYATKNRLSTCARSPQRQAGFVLTVELLILITVLLLGTLVGIVAIRDALVKHYVNKQSHVAIVVDAQNRVLGQAVDFDEHDAPRLFYIDRSQPTSYRALLGVRDDRFTSREALYYAGPSCQGEPCIKTVSDEAVDNTGVDGVSGSGAVSYFNALQRQPNYAVGRAADGLPGALYRETPRSCPLEANEIGSRWVSQKVVQGLPCEAISLDGLNTDPSYNACLVETAEPCACPAPYEDEADILTNYLPQINDRMDATLSTINLLLPPGQQIESVEIGTLCCAEAFDLRGDDLVDAAVYVAITQVLETQGVPSSAQSAIDEVLAPMQGEILCEASLQLMAAESVSAPDASDRNALEVFTPPFRVNLPAAGGSGQWHSTVPRGEGAAAGL